MSIVQKLKSFWLGPSEAYDHEDFEELFETRDDIYATNGQLALDKAPSDPVKSIRQPQMSTGGKVVEHPNAQPTSEIKVIEPRAFDESLEIVDELRARKSILLNLHLLDNEQSQRVVDFLCGATHALDGHQQKVGDGVFMFAPANVQISSESSSSKAIKEAFWTRTQST